MKIVRITAHWRSYVKLEVPDDQEEVDLMDLPMDLLAQVDTQGAELVDWDMTWK